MALPVPLVKLPDCQLNWEKQNSLNAYPKVLTVGPLNVTPTVNLGGTATALTGLSLTFTTPSFAVAGEIKPVWRADTNVAAWTFIYSDVGITPAPLTKFHTNVTTGSVLGGAAALDLMYGHSGGEVNIFMKGVDYATFAANTTYTIQVYGGASGAVSCGGIAENSILFTYWPL